MKVIAVVDAGGSEKVQEPLKPRDQQCIMVLIAEAVPPGQPGKAVIVYCASNDISRVCHSSFDMESVAGVAALATASAALLRALDDKPMSAANHYA